MSIEEILLVRELTGDNFRGRGKTKGKVSTLHPSISTEKVVVELYAFLISVLCDALQEERW